MPVSNASMAANNSDVQGLQVQGVEAVMDANGNPMTVASVTIDNQSAMLVDVDNNGMMDAIMIDENHDGEISSNEIFDISAANIEAGDLMQQVSAGMEHDNMLASNGDMPDYMNDADVSSLV